MTASIGLVHPGEMGARVGVCLVASGARVVWASQARSADTARRAEAAGLVDCGELASVVADCERILSVCPPAAALDVATRVRDLGFRGLYVDANAVSPSTARTMAGVFDGADVDLVDGGIVGPPPVRSGLTRLYLSGPRAREVKDWFSGSDLEAIVLEGPVGAASALKMTYAGWTKGTTALLAAIYATARAEGVADDLVAEWQRSVPELDARLQGLPGVGRKAWRFEGEMREIASTLESAGLPGGFHQAAAEVYERLAGLRGVDELPDLDELVRLVGGARKQRG